jgi:lysophospholipase L1-like esterase
MVFGRISSSSTARRRFALLAVFCVLTIGGVSLVQHTAEDREFIPRYLSTLHSFHQRVDERVAPGAFVLIGDSHAQGLNVRRLSPRGINFGVGWESAAGWVTAMKAYGSLRSAEFVVVIVGTNDLFRGTSQDDLTRAIERIMDRCCGRRTQLLMVPPPPIDERAIRIELNRTMSTLRTVQAANSLETACSARPNCHFVAVHDLLADQTGMLAVQLHRGDGVHLNANGYALLEQRIVEVSRLALVSR